MKKLALLSVLLVLACSKDDSNSTNQPEQQIERFRLTVNANEGGSVSTNGGTFEKGTEITLTATPNTEFLFTSWSNGATANPLKIVVNSDLEITANFEKRKYALTVNIEGEGTVTEEIINAGKTTTEYTSGSIIRLTAEPLDEWVFVAWTGSVQSTENPLEITVDEAKDLTATFEKRKYPLIVTIEGEGTVKEEIVNAGKVVTDYISGSTIRLTAEPSEEWVFVSWSGAIEGTENPIEISIDEAKEVTATFEINQYNLEVNAGEGGTIDTVGGTFDFGSQITITATPNDDYFFSHWSDDSEENPRTISMDSDIELEAIFKNKFEIDDGYYIRIGFIADDGSLYYDDSYPIVYEYKDNQVIFNGRVFYDIASFPIFKDIGDIIGEHPYYPVESLTNTNISRNVIHREYFDQGVRWSWLLQKIAEEDIPHKKTHGEIMQMLEGNGFWSDPIYSKIDPENPVTYIMAFIEDAERHGLDLSFVDVDKIMLEFSEEVHPTIFGAVGVSHLSCIDDDRVQLWYYKPFWDSASYYDIQNERLTVMYHELGHDILNSGHPATGEMKQFMNQGLGDDGPIVWDDSDPMFSFRRMVDDMFSGVGLDYPCNNGATDYSNSSTGKSVSSKKWNIEECFHKKRMVIPMQ